MQIDVHRIDAEVAGPDLADDRVEVRAVAIDEGAGGMDRVADRLHVRLEQTAGVRVGNHHCRDVGAEPRLQRLQVDAAFLRRRNILDAITAEGGRRRVGAVGALRHQHDLARVAPRFERGANAQKAAQLAMGPCLGAHRHAIHAGQRDQPFGERVDHLQRSLHRLLRLERVDVGESRQPRHLLVEARIMLHRTGAKRKQPEVDGVILARQTGVVAHRFRLAEAGQVECRALEIAQAR
jgi:hypothetical protein